MSEGLSAEEIKAVRDTWVPVRQKQKEIGVLFFMELFKQKPHYQKGFKSFANVPYDQLKDNKRLAAHGTNVISALTNVVDNLDDMEVLEELLFKIGENHGKRSLTAQDFEIVSQFLASFLSSTLGPELFSPAAEAWQKTLEILVRYIGKGLDSVAANK